MSRFRAGRAGAHNSPMFRDVERCPETGPAEASSRAEPAAHDRGVDLDVLADLLTPALGRTAAREVAAASLERAGDLRRLCALPSRTLAQWPGWNLPQARALDAASRLVSRRLELRLLRGSPLTSPADTMAYLRATLSDLRREVFYGVFLDTRHRVIRCEQLFLGSIDGACVYPRVVAEKALMLGAAALIVAHNHPSGVSEPSLADQAITRRLKDALALLEIRLLDHFVIGEGEPVSMASRGLL